MTEKEYRDYEDAVDAVCIRCHYLCEETCESCPVRKTMDEMNEERRERK